jgi:hypothetical protein
MGDPTAGIAQNRHVVIVAFQQEWFGVHSQYPTVSGGLDGVVGVAM